MTDIFSELLVVSILSEIDHNILSFLSGLITGLNIGYRFRKLAEQRSKYEKIIKIGQTINRQLSTIEQDLDFVSNFRAVPKDTSRIDDEFD